MKNKKKHILIVDDDQEHRLLLFNILRKRYLLTEAANGEQALAAAVSPPLPDLILLDVMLPDIDGFEVCRRLKKNRETTSIPVIFLSGKNTTKDETNGFTFGAVDYIFKPVNPVALLVRLQTCLSVCNMADQDTDLPNYRLFYDLLTRELHRAVRYQQTFAVGILHPDIGHLERGSLGEWLHAAGAILRQTIRTTDTLARIGESEFAFLLTSVGSLDNALAVCNKVLQAMNTPLLLHGKPCNVGVSIGLSLFPNHAQSVDDLLEMAEESAHTARTDGGNRLFVQQSPAS
ncbi:MAG: response regulator [Magnetococcus sp. YQC-3]